MAHVVVLGLILTLVAGILSFAVLVRRVQGKPTRLPTAFPVTLLLYNAWVAVWLVSGYLRSYVFTSRTPALNEHTAAALGCATGLVALGWLRSHFTLIEQFLQSETSIRVGRRVAWLAYGAMAVLAATWALGTVSAVSQSLFRIARGLIGDLVFPIALGGSVLLLIGARRQPDDRSRRALVVLSGSYVVLFSLLTALVLVAWRYSLASPPVLVSADLALELAYNTVTVVWVAVHADAFARALPSDRETLQSFAELCDTYSISKREREIIELVCQGLTNQQIADRLFISVGTVKDHNYTIFQKTGARNRTQLAKLFMRPGAAPDETRAGASPGMRRVV